MNQRIRALAEQAGFFPAELTQVGPSVERLAELIVQECAGKVDFILRGKSNGGGTMGDEIREHFGIEE